MELEIGFPNPSRSGAFRNRGVDAASAPRPSRSRGPRAGTPVPEGVGPGRRKDAPALRVPPRDPNPALRRPLSPFPTREAASTSNFSTEKKKFTATASPGAVPLPSPAGEGARAGLSLETNQRLPARRSQPPRQAPSDGAPARPSFTSASLRSRATHPHKVIVNHAASEGPAELLEPSPAASPPTAPPGTDRKVSSRAGGGGPESSGRSPSPRHHQPPPTSGSVEETSWAPASPNLRAGVWGVPNLTGTHQPLARAPERWRGCQ